VLIDRPNSPQSVIIGAQVTPVDPFGDVVPIGTANDVLGGTFMSRLNMDLRETKGWSYGVGGTVQLSEHAVPYVVSAPVQADRTGDSIKALSQQIRGFLGPKGITPAELQLTVANRVGRLPGQFETSEALLNAMQSNALFRRPDNYYEMIADRYRGQTQASVDAALRGALDPNGFVWVVVGDAAKIRPQLNKLGMPIEVIQPR
jgi:predicted Zn-dependent peptidase